MPRALTTPSGRFHFCGRGRSPQLCGFRRSCISKRLMNQLARGIFFGCHPLWLTGITSTNRTSLDLGERSRLAQYGIAREKTLHLLARTQEITDGHVQAANEDAANKTFDWAKSLISRSRRSR